MVKEVNEGAAEYVNLDKHDRIPNDDEESTINLKPDNWIAIKQVDELDDNKNSHLAAVSTDSKSMSDIYAEDISKEPYFHSEGYRQEQVLASTSKSVSHLPKEEAELSFGAAQSKLDSRVHEDSLREDSQLENCFRAAPLSNRERLLLRKQALKMRKRPVLAVGRNNIVTGVAKTIKTHFEKHPLAIVNIKGRAKGTSAQEVIFELEQATGAVLVSREPNKVILYRGWGEGEAPPGGDPKERERVRGPQRNTEEDTPSPKLMEAIRVECGLSISRVE